MNEGTVLVVDDDRAIRELIAFTLEQAGYRTLPAESAERALGILRETLPTGAVIDWTLPGMSGLTLLNRLRQAERTANLPIVIVTANADPTQMITGLEQGADDYVVKPFNPRELVARIRAVLRTRSPENSDLSLSAGPLRVDPMTRSISLDGVRISLRRTEYELLRLFIAHPNRVFTRQQLLNRVWGDHVFVEERTVDVHVRRVRLALGELAGGLIGTVRGGGYRLGIGETGSFGSTFAAGE